MDQDEALDKNYDARLLRRLLVYLRPYRGLTTLAVLLLLRGRAGAGGAGFDPAGSGRGHSRPRHRPAGYAGRSSFWPRCVLEFLVEYGQTLLTTYLGQRVMYDLRMQIFGHLQRLSISYFDRNPVGRLMTRVTSDVETLNELFSSGVVTVFGDVFTLLAIMTMMLWIDWRLALVTFAVIPLVWLTARIFRRRVRQAFGDIRVRLARLNAYPAGAALGNAGGPAIRPRSRFGGPIRRAQPGSPGGSPALDHDLRRVLPGGGAADRRGHGAAAVLRRAPCAQRDHHGRACWRRSSSSPAASSSRCRISRRSSICCRAPWPRPSGCSRCWISR